MPPILKSNFQRGGIRQLSAKWLNTVADILNGIEGIGCVVERDTLNVRWRIDATQGGNGVESLLHSWKVWLRNDQAALYEWNCTCDGVGGVAGRIKLANGDYQDVTASGWTEYNPLVDFTVYLKLTLDPAGVDAEIIGYPFGDILNPIADEELNPTGTAPVVLVYELATISAGQVYQWISDDVDLTGKIFPRMLEGWFASTDPATPRPLYVDNADGKIKIGETTTC